ncbi:Phox homologous domain-containing protein [Chaetomium tenue]|uniref:Phox homologous domain-containing protein n=1 Tax=Chaetomium tenue TaxID=1854479 RepID=A0ACB7PRQ3_9PEZI|nr:Phox homologous domain-containing protein [Chaetomium globosum]
MAPDSEQEQHPQQPAQAEQPPEPSRNGNTDSNQTGESADEPPSPTPVNDTTQTAPARTSLFPSDDDGDDTASIPSDASPSTDEGEGEGEGGKVVSPSASIPPYWSSARAAEQHLQSHPLGPHGHGHGPGHARGASSASAESVLPPGAITLQDNEGDDDEDDGNTNNRNGNGNGNGEHAGRRSNSSELYGRERNRACWARSVQVTDHVLVNGSTMSIGAFVVWNIRVEALNGSRMNIRKRYSEFDDLRRRLVQTFPGFEAAVPALPPKSVLKRFHPRFLEKRRAGLQYFLNCILLNPEFSGSPVLKEFLFS